MKKWIKELAEKAGLEQERWSTTSQFESFLEKFAELIVREAHEVIVVGGVDAVDDVLNHFGVQV